jgi:hypothetical protein
VIIEMTKSADLLANMSDRDIAIALSGGFGAARKRQVETAIRAIINATKSL